MSRALVYLSIVAALAVAPGALLAHETDHHTVPPGREQADLGDFFTRWAYAALVDAVNEANEHAREAADRGDEAKLAEIGTQDYIFEVTYRQFPNAYFVIEGFEHLAGSSGKREVHPGQVVRYKTYPPFEGLYAGAYLPIDPRNAFRLWHASVIKAYGVYFGTDKVGHFTDMGKNYYEAYRNALRNGATEEEAVAAAIRLGTRHPIYSEGALLGYWTAGAYSNGDLASNYAGFLFYRNLTEEVNVAGEKRPPLLEWDGARWTLGAHVRRDSDFFSYFITDHWDEALNPSIYEVSIRGGILRNVRARPDVLWRYRDANGNRRLPLEFVQKALELSTFDGERYGHRGSLGRLITLAELFEPLADDAPHDARNARGHTPLHDAVAWGRLADARHLLEQGADVDVAVEHDDAWPGDLGCTPLHLAARSGQRDMVRLLLRYGADPGKRDARGAGVAHHAAGHPEVLAMLIEAGAPLETVARNGQTALHWSAAKDDEGSTRLLLESGVDPDVADATGRTALHRAAEHGSAGTVAALAEQADVNAGDHLAAAPLHVAAARRDRDAEPVVRALLEAGADAAVADARGRTPLHEAARVGRQEALERVAEAAGQMDLADAWGTTPLHIASRRGRETVAHALIDRGARIDVANAAGLTPLHEAAHAGWAPLVTRLVEAGADPTIQDGRGRTAAALARTNGFHDLTDQLEVREAAIHAIERE